MSETPGTEFTDLSMDDDNMGHLWNLQNDQTEDINTGMSALDAVVEDPQQPDEDSTYGDFDLDNVLKSTDLMSRTYDPAIDRQTLLGSLKAAEAYRDSVRIPKIVPDHTVPSLQEDLRAHVKLLVRAYMSVNNAEDNPGVIVPFIQHRHAPHIVECLCWNLLHLCMSRSRSDEPLIHAYEPLKIRRNLRINTFAQRFDQIVISLAKSKSICKHLYDAPYSVAFVDDPTWHNKRVDQNRGLNKRKATTISKGKEVEESEGKLPKRRKGGKKTLEAQTEVVEKAPVAEVEPTRLVRGIGGRIVSESAAPTSTAIPANHGTNLAQHSSDMSGNTTGPAPDMIQPRTIANRRVLLPPPIQRLGYRFGAPVVPPNLSMQDVYGLTGLAGPPTTIAQPVATLPYRSSYYGADARGGYFTSNPAQVPLYLQPNGDTENTAHGELEPSEPTNPWLDPFQQL